MSSQLGQHQKAICFQLLSEENKGGKVRQSTERTRGGVDKQWTTEQKIIPLTCATKLCNHVEEGMFLFFLPVHNLLLSISILNMAK